MQSNCETRRWRARTQVGLLLSAVATWQLGVTGSYIGEHCGILADKPQRMMCHLQCEHLSALCPRPSVWSRQSHYRLHFIHLLRKRFFPFSPALHICNTLLCSSLGVGNAAPFVYASLSHRHNPCSAVFPQQSCTGQCTSSVRVKKYFSFSQLECCASRVLAPPQKHAFGGKHESEYR